MGRRTLGAEELAGDVKGLAAHNDNLLAVEQLLGDGAGKATEQVPFAVNDLLYKSAINSMRYCVPSILNIGSADRGLQCRRVCMAWNRSVRTMTGSKVDMVSIPGVVLEVSCRGRGS
jgi:hypothetical protein